MDLWSASAVEPAHFVSVLSLVISRVLSSTATLPRGQARLRSGTPVPWCHRGLLTAQPLLPAQAWLRGWRLQAPHGADAWEEALPLLPQHVLAGMTSERGVRSEREGSIMAGKTPGFLFFIRKPFKFTSVAWLV